jgi:KipI family sensor histidine kinase inhibitor
MRVLPYGPEGWLVEVPEPDVVAFAAAVERRRDPDVAELVPAASTVLVRLRPGADARAVAGWLAAVVPDEVGSTDPGDVVDIPVRYDGEDLEAVAAACGLSSAEVVERHRAAEYTCAFCGFAPGFAYLRGLDPSLVLPRRATPRTRVPAGAVAIADTYTAVYPSVSPGGWHLIGSTDAPLWDATRQPPSLIRPGSVVRFVAR